MSDTTRTSPANLTPAPHDRENLFRRVSELHELVRRWADTGSKLGSVPTPVSGNATAVYVDLMFAYGLARLGEVQRSRTLADDARSAVELLPTDDARGLSGRFLFRAFMYRIDQASAGHRMSDQLAPTLLDELDEIGNQSKGVAHSPHRMAHFVISRMLVLSRILDPFERVDPYQRFIVQHEGGLKATLYALTAERNSEQLSARVRELYRQQGTAETHGGTPSITEEQFVVLRHCLPLAGAGGPELAAELVRLIPDALRQPFPKEKDLLFKQAHLLERGLYLTGHFGLRHLAGPLVGAFTELLEAKAGDEQFELVSRVSGACVRCLRQLGLRDELEDLLRKLTQGVHDGGTLADLKVKCAGRPEQWLRTLRVLLNIAGGWQVFGDTEQVAPILDEARNELLSPPARRNPLLTEQAGLATGYITAVGQGSAESGMQRLGELFGAIHPAKITNAFVTASFYSRLHLEVAEAVVLAVLELLQPAPSLRKP